MKNKGTLKEHRRITEAIKNRDIAAAKEAVESGAVQVTMMTPRGCLSRQAQRLGFVGNSVARFCWWSADQDAMNQLLKGEMYWVLADSDNDEP